MNELEQPAVSNTEQQFVANRTPANSDAARLAEIEKRLGWDQPDEEQVQEQQVAATSFVREGHEGGSFGKTMGEAGKAVADMASAPFKNPGQTAAGAGDVVSNVAQFGYDVLNSVDEFMVKRGWTQDDLLSDDFKMDLGGYLAPKPITDSEKIARGTGKFLTQFAAFAASGGVGTGFGAIARGAAAGSAVSFLAFDPHEERLSDFVQEYPALQNPITAYLASSPDDTAMEGRFKNAIESVLGDAALATAFHGFMKITKGARNMRASRGASQVTEVTDNIAARAVSESASDAAAKAGVTPVVDNPVTAAADAVQTAKTQGLPEGVSTGAAAEQAATTAQQTAKTVDLAAETRNADLPPGMTPEQVAQFKAANVGKTTASRVGSLSEDEIKRLAGITNLEKMGLEQSPAARSALNNEEALMAQKMGISVDELNTGALKLLKENPESLLTRQKGQAVDPYMTRAANIAVDVTNSQMRELEQVIEAAAQSGTRADEMEALLAQYVQLGHDMDAWVAAKVSTENVSGLSLAAARGFGKEVSAMAELKALQKDVIKFSAGNSDSVLAMVRQNAQIRAKTPELLEQARELSKWGSTKKATQHVYMNFMLSNPMTHVRNIVSNTANLVLLPIEKMGGIAGRLFPKEFEPSSEMVRNYFGKSPSQVSPSELAEFKALMGKAAPFEEMGHAAIGGVQGLLDNLFTMRFMSENGTMALNHTGKYNIGIKTLTKEQFDSMSWMQKAAHYLSHFKSPTSALGAEDAFMGAIAERMEHRALAARYANNLAKSGPEKQVLFQKALNEPPKFMQKMIVQERNKRLFTQDVDGSIKKVVEYLDETTGGRMLAPFVKVDINATREALQRMSVFGFLSKETRAAWDAGGAARDAAVGKMALGTGVALFGATLAAQGTLTGEGPKNPSARRNLMNTGWKPYSIKIGNEYHSLKAFEGLGKVFKVAADVYELASYYPEADKNQELYDLTLTGIALAIDQITPDFLIEDMGKVTNFIRNPESVEAQNFVQQKISSMTTPGIARFAQQKIDGVKRTTMVDPEDDFPFWTGVLNNMKANIPGLSATLPPQRNLWGEEITYTTGLGSENASPIAFTKDKDLTVEREFVRLGIAGPLYQPKAPEGERHFQAGMPPKSFQEGNTKLFLNPEQYDDFVQLAAGNYEPMVRAGMMKPEQAKTASATNLKAQIKRLIQSPSWEKMTDKHKKITISEVMKVRREQAKQMVLAIHPELQFDRVEGQIADLATSGADAGVIQKMRMDLKTREQRSQGGKGAPRL
jgi:hypothetical protein